VHGKTHRQAGTGRCRGTVAVGGVWKRHHAWRAPRCGRAARRRRAGARHPEKL